KSDARRIRLRRRAPGLLHEIAQSRGLIHPHLLHLPGRRCLPYTNRDTMASAMATGWGASMSSGTDCPVVMKDRGRCASRVALNTVTGHVVSSTLVTMTVAGPRALKRATAS